MIANMRMDRFNSGFILAWCSFCFYYSRMSIFLVSGWCRSTITECVSPVKFLIASGGSYFCQCLYRTPTNLSILILQCLDQGIHSAYCPFSYLAIAAAPRTHPYWSSCNSCIRSGAAASLAPSPIGPSAIAALASSSESRPWQSRYCYLDCFGCPILPNDSAVERRISSSWCPNFLIGRPGWRPQSYASHQREQFADHPQVNPLWTDNITFHTSLFPSYICA